LLLFKLVNPDVVSGSEKNAGRLTAQAREH
jgi:hypothetical protein